LCPPSDGDAEWTRVIDPVLRAIGEQNGFFVQWKGYSKGEFKKLDFAYFSKDPKHVTRTSKGKDLYWHLEAAIEHENQRAWKKTRRDFYKVCLLAIPLRVMIGYGSSANATENAENLMKFYNQMELQQVTFGETLLIMSTRHTLQPCKWNAWLRRGDAPWKHFERTE
jgi:hypothetical protein